MGINSLEQLFLNSYNLNNGKFEFIVSPEIVGRGQRVDMKALAQYRALIQQYKSIFGNASQSDPTQLTDLILSPIHDEAYCKSTAPNPRNQDPDAGALLNHAIRVNYKSPKLAAYLAVLKKMKAGMDTYRKRLLAIVNTIFIKSSLRSGIRETITFGLNPRLTERTLETIVEQTRTTIAEMYARCHLDFKEAVRIFISIAEDAKSSGGIEENEEERKAREEAAKNPVPVAAAAAAAPAAPPAAAALPIGAFGAAQRRVGFR